MRDVVRIGAGSGFAIDSGLAVPQLLRGTLPDYVIFEQLSEGTISFFFQMQAVAPELGYSQGFVDTHAGPYLAQLLAAGVKLITNAGGLNVEAAARAVRRRAAELGLNPKIAVVDGCNLSAADLAALGAEGYRDMFTGEAWSDKMFIANAYFGGFPIAAALAQGADIVITGRVVDSALSLGPLIHEFGWTPADYDKLAAGTAVGHLLECGTQATGGTFTDWLDVPGADDLGFPIAECRADGSFTITKTEGTGGLVSVGTVSEQLLYEVSDPRAYLVPDVACDFTTARITQAGPDRVAVSGVRGRPPSGCYKVCGVIEDGWRVTALIPVLGVNALAKAEKLSDIVLTRTRRLLDLAGIGPWKAAKVDLIGSGQTFAVAPSPNASQTEILIRIVVIHDDKRGATIFRDESTAMGTNGCPGNISMGFPAVTPVHRLFSFLLPRDKLVATITQGEETIELRETARPAPAPERPDPVPNTAPGGGEDSLPLIALAWGRSGDKGNLYNVAVIARRPEYLPHIRAALTEAAVADWLGHTFDDPAKSRVRRYDVPGIHALNFVVNEALGGGASVMLNLDGNGKGMAQKLLQIPIPVPRALAKAWGQDFGDGNKFTG